MPTEVTDFQCPDPETVFEEIKPFVILEGDVIVIKDPNVPPIEPREVLCCQCTSGITICIPEQQDAEFMTSAGAQTLAFWQG